MHRIKTFSAVVFATVLLAGCDSTIAPTVAGLGGGSTSTDGRAALVISPSTLTLSIGASFPLTTNAASTDQDLLQWSSLSPDVAAVSPTGVVFAQSAGSATIQVSYSDDTTNVGTAVVTVSGAGSTGDVLPRR